METKLRYHHNDGSLDQEKDLEKDRPPDESGSNVKQSSGLSSRSGFFKKITKRFAPFLLAGTSVISSADSVRADDDLKRIIERNKLQKIEKNH